MKKYKRIVILSIIMLIFNMLATLPIKAADNLSKVTINVPANLVDEKVALWKVTDSTTDDEKKLFEDVKNDDDETLNEKFGTPLGEQSINNKEKIVFENLEKGIYYIKQLDTGKKGKRLSPLMVKVDSLAQDVVVTGKSYDSEVPKRTFKFVKVDKETRTRLQGAVFDILVKKDGQLQPLGGELTSNEQGEFEINDVEVGTYYLREIKAPDGYKKLNYNLNFEVGEDNSKNYLEVENEKVPGIEMPNTGDTGLMYAAIFGVSLFILGFIIVKRENKK